MDFLQELQQKASFYEPKVKGTDCWIKCPFHSKGQERTASCRINLVKTARYPAGFFYCYGCGVHGNWNDLAEKLGLELLTEEEEAHQDLIITKLTPAEKSALLGTEEAEIMNFKAMVDWNPKKVWRKINGQLLRDLGAKKFYNKAFNYNQIFLPCYQHKELVGGIKAVLERVGNAPAYFNTAGPWVKRALFPYDFTRRFMLSHGNIVALVEGPRDALNLLQGGFPALAILGSKNWSTYKAELVTALDPDLIVLAFDNDNAGISATESVSESFKDYTNVIQLTFKEGQDPGDLTLEEIQKYYKKVLKLKDL